MRPLSVYVERARATRKFTMTLAALRGLLLGLAVAAAATWWLRGQLYGVSPWDLASYAVALPVLALVAVAARRPADRLIANSAIRGSVVRNIWKQTRPHCGKLGAEASVCWSSKSKLTIFGTIIAGR